MVYLRDQLTLATIDFTKVAYGNRLQKSGSKDTGLELDNNTTSLKLNFKNK